MSENTEYETLKAERNAALNTCTLIAEALGITGAVAGETIARAQQLIAQLEAAQKERDDLREKVNQADSEWHKMADRILSAGKRAEKAEAALSAANDKLNKPVVLPPRRSASSFVDEEFSNKDLAAIYNAARVEFSVKITNAGFTVEDE
ncbi:hypothetical protein A9Q61_12740 [Yersinia ruckeri]|uniref:hypothetical protein n=1 Tax=Yersinia ruckeri TaxID=29486 RepID=UPI0008FDE31D|nr:hypothetical protein [Yersinia ruckeri]OJB80689.1 hypothetical protein A9Q61_12740 [Yersinia ruckeri]